MAGGGIEYRVAGTRWELPAALATSGARLTLVANPNNPSSTLTPVAELRELADRLDGILVVDEAYIDFALGADPSVSMLPHLNGHPNLIVLRTFSKSYSLAGARIGLLFAAAPLVAEMNKVKDSYNVNAVTQALGIAALEDREYHARVIAQTLHEKSRLEGELAGFGWTWPAAWGNFLLCNVEGGGGGGAGPTSNARELRDQLRARKLLVRYWNTPELRDCLRITVGSAEQNTALLSALRTLV
jgi:histidinol-phosphate aminotransferase